MVFLIVVFFFIESNEVADLDLEALLAPEVKLFLDVGPDVWLEPDAVVLLLVLFNTGLLTVTVFFLGTVVDD